MKKLAVIFLSLILAISICGCFNNEKREAYKSNISTDVEKENMKTYNNESVGNLEEKSHKLNITNDENTTNNTIKTTKRYDFSKSVDIDKMFLNLPYNEEMDFDGKVIKKYKNITFAVSKKPIDFSYAYAFNEVKKYPQRDIFGNYTYYEFIPQNTNLSISYCYYRKVGNYYIVMQTYEKSKRATDLWINWTKHIFSLFEEK
ncbi:conserved hypothetical protein [Methanocaldococcus sp. FS406-22]|uniref:hypothetical protein n=1 Tax=Methanocaldococcus sp. (strain FS406-22) TaxID=644281 RepID=UPI0001BF2A16|nr:hypothetical protein [Methanocaldococcus sp. FS406-22]ADC68956.1 conserved hypothetical protein [Methanocaldococcus sp. FS406-22]